MDQENKQERPMNTMQQDRQEHPQPQQQQRQRYHNKHYNRQHYGKKRDHHGHRNQDNLPQDDFLEEEAPPARPENVSITKIADLQRMNMEELSKYAHTNGIANISMMSRSQVVFEIVRQKIASPNEVLVGEGTLEILPDGF